MPLALYAGIESTWVILIGLSIYGFIFAMNSSVHSYLVLQYASRDEVASDVGFYYASNAAGACLAHLPQAPLLGWGQRWCWWTLGLPLGRCGFGGFVRYCSLLLPNGEQTESSEKR